MKNKNLFFEKAFYFLAANILNASIPFLLLPVLTRILTPADYGIVAMFGLSLNVLGAFTGLSVHGAISVRYFQIDKNSLAQYIGACIAILTTTTVIIFLLVLTVGEDVAVAAGIPLFWIKIACVVSAFQFIINIRLSLWQVEGKAKTYGVYQVLLSLLNALISLVLIFNLNLSWIGRLIGQSVSVIILGVIGLVLMSREGYLHFGKKTSTYVQDALGFGLPLIPHVLGGMLIVAADRLIVVRQLDISQAGIYMVGLQIGQVLSLATDSFNKAYAPWLLKNIGNASMEMRRKIVAGTYIYFIIIFLFALLFGISAPYILGVLVGKSFEVAKDIVPYIAFGFAFGGCYLMVANYIFYENKTKILALITFAAGVLNLPVMYLLVTFNGLIGAGQAFVITQALIFFATWWLAHKVHRMPWAVVFHAPKNVFQSKK